MSQPPQQTNKTRSRALIVAPEGWTLRPNLSQVEVKQLLQMQNFIQNNCHRVASMQNAVITFRENQVYLSQGNYQTHQERVAMHLAIQQMMQIVRVHWQRVKIVYVNFLNLGFYPPKKAATSSDPCSSSRPADDATAEI